MDYARTRLANDAKAAKKGGGRQFNGMVDVYSKTLKSDGIAGLYRGFNISCVGIIVYRGLYFGMYDSLKPVVLVGDMQVCTKSECEICSFLICCVRVTLLLLAVFTLNNFCVILLLSGMLGFSHLLLLNNFVSYLP